jgi:hypothetical protein
MIHSLYLNVKFETHLQYIYKLVNQFFKTQLSITATSGYFLFPSYPINSCWRLLTVINYELLLTAPLVHP